MRHDAITNVGAHSAHELQIQNYEQSKVKKHQDAVIHAGGIFHPFVLSTQGEFGQHATKVVDLICSTAVDLRYILDSQRLLFKAQVIRHLAIALQVQNVYIVSRMRMPNRLLDQEMINSEFLVLSERVFCFIFLKIFFFFFLLFLSFSFFFFFFLVHQESRG